MTDPAQPIEACPRCRSSDRVRHRLALIDKGHPEDPVSKWQTIGASTGAPSVSDLKPEFVTSGSTAQFIPALYCERCGIGYIPEHMVKLPRPAFLPVPGGFRRICSDGTLGPLLERMTDDPDLQQAQ